MELLKQLCKIISPSGSEEEMKDFLLHYIEKNCSSWKVKPEIYNKQDLQNSILLTFGNPRVTVFAHVDTTGFMVRYNNQLLPVGGPEVENGYTLVGNDHLGPVECKLELNEEGNLFYNFGRGIARGTLLTFKQNFVETDEFVQSPYLDNRVGIWIALKLAESMENGMIAFTTWEEHGGGSVPVIARIMHEEFGVKQALIADTTWVSDGIFHDGGVVISLRDRNIPRRLFVNRIIDIARKAGIKYQIEIEGNGSSDGRELQISPYPIDWCFIGPAEDNVHSPNEIVHKNDMEETLKLYQELLKVL